MKIKEGTKEAAFSCEFVKPNAKLKWFKNKLEIFNGHKYHFKNEGNIYKLILHNVKLEDGGKYTLECNGVKSSAWLYVEGRFPVDWGFGGGLCTYINMKEVLVKAAVRKYKITIALHPSALNFVHFPLRPCSQTPKPMV